MNYQIAKPTLPIWTAVSIAVIMLGVVALGIIAFLSLTMLGIEAVPAALLAGVIEYCTFTAAVNLLRGIRIAWVEIIIGLLFSGVVNFVHFRAVNDAGTTKITEDVLIGILAVCPLLVVFASGLFLGKEVANHEARVKAWEVKRADWLAGQEAERRERAEAVERARQVEQERIQDRQHQLDLARIDAERDAEIARIKAEARILARQVAPQPSAQGGNLPETSDWRKLPDEDKAVIKTLSTSDIVQRYGVTDRTARNWRNHTNGKAAHNGAKEG